jgi:hypothetical protein
VDKSKEVLSNRAWRLRAEAAEAERDRLRQINEDHCRAVNTLSVEALELTRERDRLRDALESVEVYGSDTLSGRSDGPNDAAWYREGVAVMRDRARAALKGDTQG